MNEHASTIIFRGSMVLLATLAGGLALAAATLIL